MFIDVKGFEGIYQISPQGEIMSTYRNRVLKGWVEKIGYRAVSLWKNGKAHRHCIHVLVAEHFIPNPHNLPEVNHKDGVKLNNDLLNLEWVTGCSNIRHAFTQGLTKNTAIIDYSKIPKLLNEVYSGTPLVVLCNREGIQESSSLRKLLKREAERLGQLEQFNQGTKLARASLVQKQSKIIVQSTLTKTFIAEHLSINAAARSINSSPASVFKAIKKAKHYKGFYWELKDA